MNLLISRVFFAGRYLKLEMGVLYLVKFLDSLIDSISLSVHCHLCLQDLHIIHRYRRADTKKHSHPSIKH